MSTKVGGYSNYAVEASFKYAMRSLRSAGFLIPAKTILVPCDKRAMWGVRVNEIRSCWTRGNEQGITIVVLFRIIHFCQSHNRWEHFFHRLSLYRGNIVAFFLLPPDADPPSSRRALINEKYIECNLSGRDHSS